MKQWGHDMDVLGDSFEYGDLPFLVGRRKLWCRLEVDEADLALALRLNAIDALPPRTRYEIRKKFLSQGMGWFRDPAMDADANWGKTEPGPKLDLGYILVSQEVTPTTETA